MSEALRLVLATANPDKALEMNEILEELLPGAELMARPENLEEVEEMGGSYLDNARLKAEALVAATGLPAVADDSGVEVEALDGAPGLYSARYAGDDVTYADNVNKLLHALDGVENRRARFVSVVLALFPDGREFSAEGVVEGEIGKAPRGEGGFGYDPVFLPDGGGGQSYAELDSAKKHALSHRGLALRALVPLLAEVVEARRITSAP